MLGFKLKGSWRQYQKQVLDRFQDYQADGHVHLVAVTRIWQDNHWYRANRSFWQSSLVLVPTVTIREQ